MKVLVTGATGYLGSALCARLRGEGHDVRALVHPADDTPAHRDALAGCELVTGDVCDRDALARAIDGTGAIFHCAGVVSVWPGDADRQRAVHVEGAQVLAEEAARRCAGRLVYVSSIGSLGYRATPEILDESATVFDGPLQTPYGVTKRMGELDVLRAPGLDAVVVLPASVFDVDLHPMIRTSLVEPLLRRRMPRVFAGGFNCVRRQDVVAGILLAWEKGAAGERYILGGENLTFAELAGEIAAAAGVAPPKRTWAGGQALVARGLVWALERASVALERPIQASQQSFLANQLFVFTTHEKATRGLGYAPGPVRPVIAEAVRRLRA
jgi:dihydroflavonol-4-reductase